MLACDRCNALASLRGIILADPSISVFKRFRCTSRSLLGPILTQPACHCSTVLKATRAVAGISVGGCDTRATTPSGITRTLILFGNLRRRRGFRAVRVGQTRGNRMKYYLFAAVAAAAIATPAQARDGQFYFGVEGGVLFSPDQDADVFVDYTTTDVPVPPALVVPPGMPLPPADTTFNNALNLDYKMGLDLDAVVG